ncbi:hypothetical protein [Treponema sp. C6A8]|uniref:hypothetical protein n=1 Tax=Treponema sp. C6A8 TaxID=1410609 RepID=UPI0004862BD2|nr:hypothetical protein [Treponema sp. C6A8]
MLLFLLLLMPLCLTAYCYNKSIKDVLPCLLLGFFISLLFCGFKSFFMFSHTVVYYSAFRTFASIFVFQIFLPVLILYGVFFFISHDTLLYKSGAFVPLVMSFYAIFLPYMVISGTESIYSGFQILIKPVLYAAMIMQAGALLSSLFNAMQQQSRKLFILNIVLELAYLVCPAIIETIYLLSCNNIIVLVTSGAYVIFVFFYLIIKRVVARNKQ